MTLTYDFDDTDFEYEPSSDEIDEYFSEQPAEVIADSAEESFDKMSEQGRSEIITQLLNNGDIDLLTKHQEGTNVRYSVDWHKAVEQDREWVMQFIDESSFKDDMRDYFYRAASDAYDDYEAEKRDPYGYRGVSERDFY